MSLIIIKKKGIEYENLQFTNILQGIKLYNHGASITYKTDAGSLKIIKLSKTSDPYDLATLVTNHLRILKQENKNTLADKEIVIYLRRTNDKNTITSSFNICPIGISNVYNLTAVASEYANVPLMYFVGSINVKDTDKRESQSDILNYLNVTKNLDEEASENPYSFVDSFKLKSEVSVRSKILIFTNSIENEEKSNLFYKDEDFTTLDGSKLLVSNASLLSQDITDWASKEDIKLESKTSNTNITRTNVHSSPEYNIPEVTKGFKPKLLDLKLNNEDTDDYEEEEDDSKQYSEVSNIKRANVRDNSNVIYRIDGFYPIISMLEVDNSLINEVVFKIKKDFDTNSVYKSTLETDTKYIVRSINEEDGKIIFRIKPYGAESNFIHKIEKDKFKEIVTQMSSLIISAPALDKFRTFMLLKTMHENKLLTGKNISSLVSLYNNRVHAIESMSSNNPIIKYNKLNQLKKIDNKLSNVNNRMLRIDGIKLFAEMYLELYSQLKNLKSMDNIKINEFGTIKSVSNLQKA